MIAPEADWLLITRAAATLFMTGLIWISTATLQVPQHRRLATAFEPSAHGSLVLTNWIRALNWSLRAALVLYWLS